MPIVSDRTTLADLRKSKPGLRLILGIILRNAPLHFFFMILLCLIAGLLLVVQASAMSTLINTIGHVMQQHHPERQKILDILQPYMLPLSILIGILLARNLINAIQLYLGEHFRGRIEHALHTVFHRKFLKLSLEHFEQNEISDLGYTSIDTSIKLTGFLRNDFQNLCTNIASVLAIIGIFFVLGNWIVALLLLVGCIPELILHLGASQERHLNYFWRMRATRRVDYWSDLLTRRESVAEIRLYGLQHYLRERWLRLREQLNKEEAVLRQHMMQKITPPIIFNHIILGITLLLLIFSTLHGQMNPGLFIALIFSLQQYQTALAAIPFDLFHLLIFIAEMQYMTRFLETGEQDFHAQGLPIPQLEASISLEHVSFTYPGSEKPVLEDIVLHIAPGERIALVGENGAGKTTLAKLLLGLYTPTTGQLLINEQELCNSRLEDWRANCGAVFQDFMRFPFTVRENIGFGQISLLDDSEAIEKAANLSMAAEFIQQLPNRYETLLAKELQGGHDLSYGQWQKLAIARAYLRDAPVLILDEPARALDARSEYEVYRQFRDLSEGHTIVLISHRLGSARLADRVLFLQDGRVTEQGTHDELLKLNGRYARLYTMQSKWYQEKFEEASAYDL